MPDATYKPAGYCPRCGYALDPGKCPECGTVVMAEQLASRPPRISLRPYVRLVLLLGFIGLSCYCCYRYYRDGDWLPRASNDVLLKYARSNWEPADREIRKRCAAGRFSLAELDKLFRQVVTVSADYLPRVPANTATRVTILVTPAGFLGSGLVGPSARSRDEAWRIEGEGWEVRGPELLGGGFGTRTFAIPPLPPGQHEITVIGVLWDRESPIEGMSPDFSLPVKLPLTITAVDCPLKEIVADRWSESLAAGIERAVSARAYASAVDRYPGLWLHVERSPIFVACEVFIRGPGHADYRPLMAGPSPHRLSWTGDLKWSLFALLPEEIDTSRPIDVQLRPCPQEALLHMQSECFAGTIEWRGLTFAKGSPRIPPQNTVSPTRVFKKEADAEDPTRTSSPATRPG